MILHCNYEELTALRHGARALLDAAAAARSQGGTSPSARTEVAFLLPKLRGDLTVRTLADLREVASGIEAIVDHLRADVDLWVKRTHPAHESAVAAYFDFAHAFSVLSRARRMEGDMVALIEVAEGRSMSPELARSFVFPD